jgi:hypothetical protein
VRALARFPRVQLAVYLTYLIAALVVTWPLITVFSTRLIGHPFGDSYEYIGLSWWFKHALQTGAPLFYYPLLAYPDGLSAIYLWSIPLQSFPTWLFAFIMPLPAAFNLSVLLTLALNGWSAFYLVSYLTGNRAAAWVAGLVFLAYPTFQGQLAAGHIGLLHQWGVALFAYILLRLHQDSQRRWILRSALLFVVGLLGSNLVLIYELLPITAVLLSWMLIRREWTAFRRILLTVFVGGLCSLLFLIPSVLDSYSIPAYLQDRSDIAFSADLLSVVSPSFQHPLFSVLDYPHRVLGIDPFEKIAYIGIAAGVLAALALWRKPAARLWLVIGLAAWILSLGPVLKIFDVPLQRSVEGYDTFVPLPWLTAQYIPLLNISRTPARFNFTVALVITVLAGYGMSVLWDAIAHWRIQPRYQAALRWLVTAGLSAFIFYEYPFFWSNGLPDMPTIPGVVPEPIANLPGREDIRAIFDIPWDHLLVDKEAMFLQTGHQRPILTGHIARRTPVDPAKLTLLQQTLDPALLNRAGADVLILHKQWDDAEGELEAFMRAKLGEPFYVDESYVVFAASETTTAPVLTTLLSDTDTITNQAESYLYTPSPGWLLFTQTLHADGRDVFLALNSKRIHTWHMDGEVKASVPLFLPEAGYYTLTLTLDPPCPTIANPALICRLVTVSQLAMGDLVPTQAANTILFERGLALTASHLAYEKNVLSVWLVWDFVDARAKNEIRFVHVIDAAGNLVAQLDESLGIQPEGSQWSEAVEITLPYDSPTGEYHVYTGWYTYPDTTPFRILADVPNSETGRLDIGSFSAEQER